MYYLEIYTLLLLSALEYDQDATDVEYLTASVDFTYQIYEIETNSDINKLEQRFDRL